VLKHEQLQVTGSFKARGAVNKVLSLPAAERERGVVAASTGNHGAAVAWAAHLAAIEALVVVPEGANPSKLAAIERQGARVRIHGSDSLEAELAARELAQERGAAFVSPYNDLAVIGGQGTLAAELLGQVDELAAVYVAVGGGGLASGVAAVVKDRSPSTRVVGCSPTASAVMYHSLRAGRVLELPSDPTLSDGTAGGVEADAITFDLLTDLLDDFVLVDEAATRAAFLDLIEFEHVLVEGSAAMTYAAARQDARRDEGTVAVVLCGGNVGVERLVSIIS
jgi:threonine dehydratase